MQYVDALVEVALAPRRAAAAPPRRRRGCSRPGRRARAGRRPEHRSRLSTSSAARRRGRPAVISIVPRLFRACTAHLLAAAARRAAGRRGRGVRRAPRPGCRRGRSRASAAGRGCCRPGPARRVSVPSSSVDGGRGLLLGVVAPPGEPAQPRQAAPVRRPTRTPSPRGVPDVAAPRGSRRSPRRCAVGQVALVAEPARAGRRAGRRRQPVGVAQRPPVLPHRLLVRAELGRAGRGRRARTRARRPRRRPPRRGGPAGPGRRPRAGEGREQPAVDVHRRTDRHLARRRPAGRARAGRPRRRRPGAATPRASGSSMAVRPSPSRSTSRPVSARAPASATTSSARCGVRRRAGPPGRARRRAPSAAAATVPAARTSVTKKALPPGHAGAAARGSASAASGLLARVVRDEPAHGIRAERRRGRCRRVPRRMPCRPAGCAAAGRAAASSGR